MINKNINKQGRNITLIGSFNPKIFHPYWFFANKLIREQEKETSKIEIITNDVAVIKMEWLQIEVIRNRFSASATSDISYEQLRDLVAGTFELLTHTPITMVGFNYDFDFKALDENNWHKIGHFLSRKSSLWDGLVQNAGLATLIVSSPEEETLSNIKRKIQIEVCPTKREILATGLHFHINDHYELEDKSKGESADIVSVVLKERWDESQKKAESVALKVIDRIIEGINNND